MTNPWTISGSAKRLADLPIFLWDFSFSSHRGFSWTFSRRFPDVLRLLIAGLARWQLVCVHGDLPWELQTMQGTTASSQQGFFYHQCHDGIKKLFLEMIGDASMCKPWHVSGNIWPKDAESSSQPKLRQTLASAFFQLKSSCCWHRVASGSERHAKLLFIEFIVTSWILSFQKLAPASKAHCRCKQDAANGLWECGFRTFGHVATLLPYHLFRGSGMSQSHMMLLLTKKRSGKSPHFPCQHAGNLGSMLASKQRILLP